MATPQDQQAARGALFILALIGAVIVLLLNQKSVPTPLDDTPPPPPPFVEPDDNPPVPEPEEDVIPGKVAILIVTDNLNYAATPPGQIEAIHAQACWEWVTAHAEFRVLDKLSGFHEVDPKWKDVISQYPPQDYPWVYISNGKAGTQGDVRGSPREQLELYQKWGGK